MTCAASSSFDVLYETRRSQLLTLYAMHQILKSFAVASVICLTGCVTTENKPQIFTQIEDSASRPLRIGIDSTYPPFAYKSHDGKLTGFDVDFAAATCAELQRDCIFVEQEWEKFIPALQAGKVDAVISSVQITSERQKMVDFTDPYYRMPHVLVMRSDATHTAPLSLSGKRVGVLRGGTDHLYANVELARLGAEVVPLPNQEQIYSELARAQLDGTLGDAIEIRDGLLGQAWGRGYGIVGEPIYSSQFFGQGAGIALRKGSNLLKEKLNVAIRKLRANGTYQAANEKYFDGYGR
jgi:arginine/ornithine transport system substrate-binding protein